MLDRLLEKSLAHLRLARLPCGVGDGLDYLTELQGSLQLVALYRHFFPAEFTASTAPILANDDSVYSPREAEFLRLVDERLFPLCLEYYLDRWLSEGESRAPNIEIRELGLDYWEEDLETLAFGWQLLLMLVGEADLTILRRDNPSLPPILNTSAGWAELVVLVESCAALNSTYNSTVSERLDQLCAAYTQSANASELLAAQKREYSALGAVGLALRVLFKDTGLVFLDVSWEIPAEGFLWTVADVEYLAEAYEATRLALARLDLLLAWLADPELALVNYRKVVELWNKARS